MACIWQICPIRTHAVVLLFHSQPHSLGLGISGFLDRDCFHINAAGNSERFACWNNACCVGDIFSSDLRPCVNIIFLASFTDSDSQFLLYINTVKRFNRRMCCKSIVRLVGAWLRIRRFGSGKHLERFPSITYIESWIRHAVKLYSFSMPSLDVMLLQRCMELVKKCMECMSCLSRDHEYLCRRYPSSDQPHNRLTTYASVKAFHCVDVQQELWVRIGKWGKENDVYAWP